MSNDRIAIISDIHANIEALHAVLDDIEKENIKNIICLGDIVGYGPNPHEAIELIKDKAEFIIRGNHDEGLVDEMVTFDFNSYAIEALKWQRNILDEKDKIFLKNLPYFLKFDTFEIVHGSLSDFFKYITNIDEAIFEKKYMKRNILFIGHTHRAGVFDLNEKKFYPFPNGGEFTILPDRFYIINPGSVGQPRDFNPLSSYLIYYKNENKVKIKRVIYPFEITRDKILKNNLPQFLGDRLIVGY
ncbi:MAG: metallophosphatase family protein [Caldisericia bacterium]|nr:metallophosphatase family protein [Caldisericia bacterium]